MGNEIVNVGGGTVNVTNSAVGDNATLVADTNRSDDRDKNDNGKGQRR